MEVITHTYWIYIYIYICYALLVTPFCLIWTRARRLYSLDDSAVGAPFCLRLAVAFKLFLQQISSETCRLAVRHVHCITVEFIETETTREKGTICKTKQKTLEGRGPVNITYSLVGKIMSAQQISPLFFHRKSCLSVQFLCASFSALSKFL